MRLAHRSDVTGGPCQLAVSSQIVNGPSLISSTSITSPNRPVATSTPSFRSAAPNHRADTASPPHNAHRPARGREPQVEAVRQLRGRGAGEPGPAATTGVG